MSARSRRKGARFERQIAKRLREIGISAERNITETRTGNAGDIDLPSHVPLVLQCKVGARPPIYRAIAEAEAVAESTDYPVAIVKRDGAGGRKADELAVMRLDDWLEFVEKLAHLVWR